jgi:hypothetical protein
MKRFTITFLLISLSLSAQSFLEQNFEPSDYYFNRQLLNPYGMKNFYDITLGFIDNVFTNIFLNPAKITDFKERYYFYLDFRGDRRDEYITEISIPFFPIIRGMIYPPIYFIPRIPDPEPKFSIGFITNPINFLSDKFFIGGALQRITKDDNFSPQTSDLLPHPFPAPLEPANGRQLSKFSTSGDNYFWDKNEMKFRGTTYSLFAGYKIDEKFSVGFSFNRFDYKKDGLYEERKSYRYTNENYQINNFLKKDSEYDHLDYTFGLSYQLDDKTNIGIKTGLLIGKVDQLSSTKNNYLFQRNIPDVSNEWDYSANLHSVKQDFNKDGKIYYSGFDFTRQLSDDVKLFGYFNFSSGKIDLSGKFNQNDSNYYYYKLNYQENLYWRKSQQRMKSLTTKNGKGLDKKTDYSGLIGVKVRITPEFNFSIGISYIEKHSDKSSDEPNTIDQRSNSKIETNDPRDPMYPSKFQSYTYFEQGEYKIRQKTMDYLYQIPVMFNFKVGEIVELTFLLNQISGGGKLEESITNIIQNRRKVINDSTIQENNIVNKYSSSSVKESIYEAEAIAGFKIFVSRKINLNLLIDPELYRQFRISQWWLSLEGSF